MERIWNIAGYFAFAVGSVAFAGLGLAFVLLQSPTEGPDPSQPVPTATKILAPTPPPVPQKLVPAPPMDLVVLVSNAADAEILQLHGRVDSELRGATGEQRRRIDVIVVSTDEDQGIAREILEEQLRATLAMGGRPFEVVDLREAASLRDNPSTASY